MAKRKNSTTGLASTSLVTLAKKFESLSAEVGTVRASLQEKENQHAAVRRSLAEATGAMFPAAERSSSRAGTSTSGRRGRNPRGGGGGGGGLRKGTLGDHVLTFMSDGTERGPADVLEGVNKGGYQSKGDSKSQAVMVNQTLTRLAKAGSLRKLGRGRYSKA